MKIPVKKRVCKNMNLSKIKMLDTLTMQAVYFSVAANLPLVLPAVIISSLKTAHPHIQAFYQIRV